MGKGGGNLWLGAEQVVLFCRIPVLNRCVLQQIPVQAVQRMCSGHQSSEET